MPGVVIDDQSFQLDAMPPSSLYDTYSSHIPQVDEVQQMFRENSFSGMNDGSAMGLSRSAPVYNRSQSALSSAAALQAFNYFNSPPTTPKKSGEHAFSPMSMLDVGLDDFPNMEGDGHGGLGSPSAVSAMAMAISAGNSASTDLRGLAFGNSSIVGSPTLADSVTAYKFLPSNNDDDEAWGSVTDVYACDQFRMFEFKVRRCMRGRSHDWTECPFAHPGEKARRRDPRRFHYSGTACPDFRKGSCRRGDACEFAHGVFECWLHPARYRTQPCKDGRNCRRRVCFFAHTPEQLRLLPAAAQAASAAARTNGLNGGSQGAGFSPGALGGSYDGSPGRNGSLSFDGSMGYDGSGGCVSHCSHPSHGVSCQSNGGIHGVCGGGHFEQAFGGNAGSHAAHCCASPQMSSPTSTLVGHTSSPPPLSPPLSPSGSPPMSPQAHHWANSGGMLQQNGHPFSPVTPGSNSHLQGAFNPSSFQVPQQQGGAAAYMQGGPCSPLSRGANNQAAISAAVAAAAQAHSNQQITPAHRRHLERLNSMPTLSIPPVEHSHRTMLQGVTSPLSSPSSCSPPSPAGVSASNMSDIIATIQQLGLNGNFNGLPPRNNGSTPYWLHSQVQSMQGGGASNHYSSGPSPLRRCSQSVPCTPTKLKWEDKSPRWEVEESEEVELPVQRVESGRDLRAKIYGKLGKEPCPEGGETPDLDWVSQLITDEQVGNW